MPLFKRKKKDAKDPVQVQGSATSLNSVESAASKGKTYHMSNACSLPSLSLMHHLICQTCWDNHACMKCQRLKINLSFIVQFGKKIWANLKQQLKILDHPTSIAKTNITGIFYFLLHWITLITQVIENQARWDASEWEPG